MKMGVKIVNKHFLDFLHPRRLTKCLLTPSKYPVTLGAVQNKKSCFCVASGQRNPPWFIPAVRLAASSIHGNGAQAAGKLTLTGNVTTARHSCYSYIVPSSMLQPGYCLVSSTRASHSVQNVRDSTLFAGHRSGLAFPLPLGSSGLESQGASVGGLRHIMGGHTRETETIREVQSPSESEGSSSMPLTENAGWVCYIMFNF